MTVDEMMEKWAKVVIECGMDVWGGNIKKVGVIVMLPNGLPNECLIMVGQCKKPEGQASAEKNG